MRTAIELSDELMRRVKLEAAREGKSIRAFFAAALELKLNGGTAVARVRREPPTVGTADGPRIRVFSSEELDELLFG
jgi:hypothetical protein